MPAARALLLTPLIGMLAACSVLSPVPLNPPALNTSAQIKPQAPRAAGDEFNPRDVLLRRYLRSLGDLEARPTPSLEEVRAFAEVGVALVQTHCLRWFGQISDRQIRKDHEDANFNVIRQLGTALLGIGGANSIIVSAYGAGNVAWEGVSENYDNAYLAAPNGKKVKQQIFALLDEQAKQLLGPRLDAAPTFNATYRSLERYADLCTHSTAREIVNTALDQTRATVDDSGAVDMVARDLTVQVAKAKGEVEEKAKRAQQEADSLGKRANDAARERDEARREAASVRARLLEEQERAQQLAGQVDTLASRLEEAQAALELLNKNAPPR